ncbi:hypothetical protein JCM10212_001310 [Sporobolomyces blumeae]
MDTPSSPPASPTKRILRSIVTGVQPTDPDVHARRWNKSTSPQRPTRVSPTAGPVQDKGGARVAGLVKEWETSFSSKPYSALPPGPSSPARAKASSTAPKEARRAVALGQIQPLAASPTSSSESRSPSTVPASFFQLQQARRTPPASPTGAKFLPYQSGPSGKENHERPSFQPSPRSPAAGSQARSPGGSASFSEPRKPVDAASDVAVATSAMTGLSLETIATRSSGSTHASSSNPSSADAASVRMASKVDVPDQVTPRKVPVPQATTSMSLPPQIVQTAPTPRRIVPPTSIVSNEPVRSVRLNASERPAPPSPSWSIPPQSPCGSSFVEALPASYPSCSPTISPLPSPELHTTEYNPLPLDNVLHLPISSPCLPQEQRAPSERPKTRARASTLGSGLKPSFAAERVKVETAEEKRQRVELEFERLLDTMELPDRTVRRKMLGLAFPLKEEMLRSAANPPSTTLSASTRSSHQRGRSLNLSASHGSGAPPPVPAKKDSSTGFKSTFLRKTKSNQSLRNSTNARSTSADPSRPSHSRTTSTASSILKSFGKSSGAGAGASADMSRYGSVDGEDAPWWANRLQTMSCAALDVKEMGRLRGRLRNEAPAWVDEFIRSGGYVGMLARLKELLEMEWREEQHDDQVLHELLRAFKALTLTACGKRALASHAPTPFLPIASLLFSEKRPGDLPCRQILVELIESIFDICPVHADALPKSAWSTPEVALEPPLPPSPPPSAFAGQPNGAPGSGFRRYQRKIKSDDSDSDSIEREEVLTPERILSTHRFVVSLMEGPPDEKEEAKVDFIKQAHRPRMFKAWVSEIADCVRDYFWIFCHSQNLFWTFEQLDVDAISAPKVPSGMTGGVEYEAMAYATAHFRLLNAVARTCPTVQAAFAFHEQLFQSGFERVLFTLRRASLVYYQSLHLEMSRYISLARSARFNLGPRILSCLDRRSLRPEELLVVQMAEQRERERESSRSGAPQIGNIF